MSQERINIDVNETDARHGEMRRGRDLLGLPVYSIAEGKHMGEINGLLVRREDCSVPGVRIKQASSGKNAFLPYTAIKTVGVDIALVDQSDALRADLTPEERAGLEMDLPGRPVFTKSGQSTGHLAGFGIDTATGRIMMLRIEADTGFLGILGLTGGDKTVEVPVAMVLSLGPDAVIVQDRVKDLLTPPPTAASEPAKQ